MGIYNEKVEKLIDLALADGELTEKERQILFRRAEAEGIDLDEFEMVLEARLYEVQKAVKAEAATVATQTPPPPPQPVVPPQTVAPPQPVAPPPVVAPQPRVAPQSQKFGDVRKCPACGAIVNTGSAACVACGYAFNVVQGNTAMDMLNARLREIDIKYEQIIRNRKRGLLSMLLDDEDDIDYELQERIAAEKMSAIRMLNAPNTRAELLGLLTSLQPICNPRGPKNGLNRDYQVDLSLAYWDLYTICINKARISFTNDMAFAPYFKFQEEKLSNKGRIASFFGF